MKNKDTQKYIVLTIVAMIVAGFATYLLLGGSETVVTIADDDPIAPWATKVVYLNLLTSDKFTGGDVASTALVYDEKPEDWGNPRGTFDDASQYTSYTASSGTVSINKEMPGTYYVVLTASGYNTEFVTLEIPDGTGRGEDLSDYNSAPDNAVQDMSLVGSTTDEDFAITLVNDTSKTVKETLLLTVAENTELRGWKVIVDDTEGFSLDTDGDGTYDEGVSKYVVTVAGITKTVFNPDLGIDEFDSNDEYTFSLDGISVMDEDDVEIKIEIDAITGDYTGANDEVWGEGEGVLSYIKIYDEQGNLFSTTDVTA